MNTRDFFIILPSNTVTDVFPNNKTSDYEISLPRALEFGTSTWEVGLVEIFFPHSWENIRSPFLQIEFGTAQGIAYRSKIEHGYYNKVEDLVEVIDSMKPSGFEGNIQVGRVNKQVKIFLHPGEYIHFHKTMAAMLGFQENEINNREMKPKRYKAETFADLHASQHHIYVYTNMVEQTLVGGGYYPLLRIIPTEGEHGTNVHQRYNNPYYHQLVFSRITNIRITLCDDQGEPVRFQFGKVICKLHFRRKQLQLI